MLLSKPVNPFKFNLKKALEAVVWYAAKEQEANNKAIDFIKINKYCYYADQYHLNKYLRSIFGDYYTAMKEGPVPSNLYDWLKFARGETNPFILARIFNEADYSLDKEFPFQVYENHYIIPKRDANLKVFSKTDIEAMQFAFDNYNVYASEALSIISHKEKAYDVAWSAPYQEMDFERIINDSEKWDFIKNRELEGKLFE